MSIFREISLIIIFSLLLNGCSLVGSGANEEDDENGSEKATSYSLTISVEPSNGGSVDPSSATYEEGSTVTVEATADEGWNFSNWTGDQESSENPLSFTINDDVSITAHFIEQAKAFQNELKVTDGENDFTLSFGMEDGASGSYDENVDRKAPPVPPGDSFYAQFVSTDTPLISDFRSITRDSTQWNIEFSPEDTLNISLNWDFSQTSHVGSLILNDDPENPSFELDMKSGSSHEVSDTSVNTLYIISN